MNYRQRLRETDRRIVRERRRDVIEALREARPNISGREIRSHLKGWDLTRPVYKRTLEPGERIVTQIRNDGGVGNYFSIPGAQSNSSMGIGDGLAGRRLSQLVVERPISVLEGTAAPISRNWQRRTAGDRRGDWRADTVRGVGGATQIFMSKSERDSALRGT
jgi:hypothetical protein